MNEREALEETLAFEGEIVDVAALLDFDPDALASAVMELGNRHWREALNYLKRGDSTGAFAVWSTLGVICFNAGQLYERNRAVDREPLG